MPISAVDSISPAFQHTKRQLLHPFRFGQWARLAFVGVLAGEAGSGGGCNFNVPSIPWQNHQPQQQETQTFLSTYVPPWPAGHPAALVGLIVLAGVLLIGLVVLFAYINSVMRFVLFDSVISGECRVRQGWVRRRSEGRRLFRWQIFLMLVSWASFIVVLGIPAAIAWASGWFTQPSRHVLSLVLIGVVAFLLLMAIFIALLVIQVMTKDFVVPQMVLEEIPAMEGWRRLWPAIRMDKGGYAGYIGMKIVLTIAAGILFGVASVIVLLVLVIPFVLLAVVAVLAGKAAGLTWGVATITLAVVAGCIALAIFVFAALMVSVPTVVFFPAYSIYFFAARYPPLAALLPPAPPPAPPSALPVAPDWVLRRAT